MNQTKTLKNISNIYFIYYSDLFLIYFYFITDELIIFENVDYFYYNFCIFMYIGHTKVNRNYYLDSLNNSRNVVTQLLIKSYKLKTDTRVITILLNVYIYTFCFLIFILIK